MKRKFPADFIFGTSTSAVQIETPFQHDWEGFHAKDGSVFKRTTDHEKLWDSDLEIISSLAPSYRMSLMWSKLQPGPCAPLDADAVRYYHGILAGLRERGISIMMVLHHFGNPIWFIKLGSWQGKKAVLYWIDYVERVVKEFGDYIFCWNTFNEPNLYLNAAYLIGEFPPKKISPISLMVALKSFKQAHKKAYLLIKSRYPNHLVGISANTAVFDADHWLGWLPASLIDWWYQDYLPEAFKDCDFFGMSYYARIGFDPFPITKLNAPEKLLRMGKPSDDMWEYYPEGMGLNIRRFWKKFQKPILITENGISTVNDQLRVSAIWDYLNVVGACLDEGIPVMGYYHWSTWDNFEWNLGNSFRFGLYGCDPVTLKRFKKPSADYYSSIAWTGNLKQPSFADSSQESLKRPQ